MLAVVADDRNRGHDPLLMGNDGATGRHLDEAEIHKGHQNDARRGRQGGDGAPAAAPAGRDEQ